MAPDDRRLRSLLRAYPRRYREHRGDEIVSTLLEAGASGDALPLRQRIAILRHAAGVRARLARPVMVVALVAALGAGAGAIVTATQASGYVATEHQQASPAYAPLLATPATRRSIADAVARATTSLLVSPSDARTEPSSVTCSVAAMTPLDVTCVAASVVTATLVVSRAGAAVAHVLFHRFAEMFTRDLTRLAEQRADVLAEVAAVTHASLRDPRLGGLRREVTFLDARMARDGAQRRRVPPLSFVGIPATEYHAVSPAAVGLGALVGVVLAAGSVAIRGRRRRGRALSAT